MHNANPLALIAKEITTPNSGVRQVVFTAWEGPNSFADGDDVYDGLCEVCHTTTKYHRNNPSGDHTHYAGMNCTVCHPHSNKFMPTFGPHPEPINDCSNCHLNPQTGKLELLYVHDYDCQKCHPVDFASTILGPIGTFNGDCAECHNPDVAETGNMQVHTKGHRCVVCHGEQPLAYDPVEMHKKHAKKANCVVCHGFIPDSGVVIGSGVRELCTICHGPDYKDASVTEIHKKHVPKGLSCLECHNDERPPVDVTDGLPVGGSTNVCQVCHDNENPGDFAGHSRQLHKKHVGKGLDCGACHLDANLQDDRVPMPEIDDPVRALVDRSGYNECAFCHGKKMSGMYRQVHQKHVKKQWQWCYNCHEGTDPRPIGLEPPVTEPAEACILCHDQGGMKGSHGGDVSLALASGPWSIHYEHAEKLKCYGCHQLTPPLFDWPNSWMQPSAAAASTQQATTSQQHGEKKKRRKKH